MNGKAIIHPKWYVTDISINKLELVGMPFILLSLHHIVCIALHKA